MTRAFVETNKNTCDIIMEIHCDVTCCLDTKHIVVLVCGFHVGDECKQLYRPYVDKHTGPEGSNVRLPFVCVGTK